MATNLKVDTGTVKSIDATINGIISGFTSTTWRITSVYLVKIPYSSYSINTSSQNMTYSSSDLLKNSSGNINLVITLDDESELTIPTGDYLTINASSSGIYTATFDAISYIDDNPNCGLTYEGQTTDNSTGNNTDSNTTEPSTGGDNTMGLKVQGPVKFITLTIDNTEFVYEDFTSGENNVLTYNGKNSVDTYDNITVTTTNGVYTVGSKYVSKDEDVAGSDDDGASEDGGAIGDDGAEGPNSSNILFG